MLAVALVALILAMAILVPICLAFWIMPRRM
jgi:hypothetical protein